MASNGKLRNMTAIYLMHGRDMLLLHRHGSRVVNDSWTGAAGGHFEECELNDALACILRELYEETGITGDMLENLSLRYITLRHTKGEVRQNYYYFADISGDERPDFSSNEGTLKWFPMDEGLDFLEMPFTARHVIRHYLKTGRYTRALYGGVTNESGVIFNELPEF